MKDYNSLLEILKEYRRILIREAIGDEAYMKNVGYYFQCSLCEVRDFEARSAEDVIHKSNCILSHQIPNE